jgi:prepilin-type N-terminal cleavage/methylation domain-containing protein
MVRPVPLGVGIPLRGHHGESVSFRHSPIADQSRQPRGFGCMHQDDLVKLSLERGLEEEGNIGNDHAGATRVRLGEVGRPASCHLGVDDRFEIASRVTIAKHDAAERRAVERAARLQDRSSEAIHDASQCGSAGSEGLARVAVGVEHGRPERGKPRRDRTLAAGDVSGEADVKHRVLRLAAGPMRNKSRRSARRAGFTIIEVAITLGVMAIMAALALPAIDFNRYRMDANSRLVQNWLLSAQSRAVQRNVQVLVEVFYDRNQIRMVDDANADGQWTSGETRVYHTLSEKMKFVTPPSTIDAVTPYYATGAGISLSTSGNRPILIFYPNGSSSGDAVFYLGSPNARNEDNRAIKITAATAKMRIYRMGANGVWGLSEM